MGETIPSQFAPDPPSNASAEGQSAPPLDMPALVPQQQAISIARASPYFTPLRSGSRLPTIADDSRRRAAFFSGAVHSSLPLSPSVPLSPPPPPPSPPLGIINPANDCFLIAAFQCLVMHDIYSAWLMRHLPEAYQPWVTAFTKYKRTLKKFRLARAEEDRDTTIVYEPQNFHMCGLRMVNTSLLRTCFLTNTSNTSVFSQQGSQQDSHEALIKLMHYLPESKTLSVVRTRYLRPTSHVYDELEADTTKLSQVSSHNTIVACQPEWDLQLELTDVKDHDALSLDELLDRLAYRVLERDMRYEVKCIDVLGCVRNYHVLADTYEWNNKEPPLACTLFLQR
jgi:hypothetical protein